MDDSLEQRISMSLDEMAGAGGKAPRRGTDARGRRSTPYENTAGRTHLAGASLADIAAAPPGSRALKVGAATSAKTLAGSVAHVTREAGEPPMLLALGASCLNQGIKGVAIARRYLAEEDLELRCLPEFRDSARSSIALKLRADPGAGTGPTVAQAEQILTVANSSKFATVAGAIAGKVRDGVSVYVKGIGAETVSIAVHAVAVAREYLALDGNGVDICCLPEFIDDEAANGEHRSVMALVIEPISATAAAARPAAVAAAPQQAPQQRDVMPGAALRGPPARRTVSPAAAAAAPVQQQHTSLFSAPPGATVGGVGASGLPISAARAAAAAALAGLQASSQDGVLTIDASHAGRVMDIARQMQTGATGGGAYAENLRITVRR